MATPAKARTIITREDLQRIDDEAWPLYGQMCMHPEATELDRTRMFDAAYASLMTLLEFDLTARG